MKIGGLNGLHRLMDTTPWLQGDIFDSVMHYHWFKVVRGYFVQSVDGLSLRAYQ